VVGAKGYCKVQASFGWNTIFLLQIGETEIGYLEKHVALIDESLRDCKILVVDDEQLYCFVLKEILEAQGMQVEFVHNPHDVLQVLKEWNPDLILLDYMMPGLDGITLLGQIRSHPITKDIAVVVASAKAMPEDRETAMNAGANAYLTKPYATKDLIQVVSTLVPEMAGSIE
jgi:CheY-like chemotaxis protein